METRHSGRTPRSSDADSVSIALWIFSLASDLIYLFDRRSGLEGHRLVHDGGGIVGGVAAAIPDTSITVR
jgi:hypothetical protein